MLEGQAGPCLLDRPALSQEGLLTFSLGMEQKGQEQGEVASLGDAAAGRAADSVLCMFPRTPLHTIQPGPAQQTPVKAAFFLLHLSLK